MGKKGGAEKTEKKQSKTAHLDPYKFKPGESGNPNGRPKGSLSITGEVKRRLKEPAQGGDRTKLQELIETILKKAIKEGDRHMIKLIWNYIEGKPSQEINADLRVGINKMLDDIDGKTNGEE